VFLWKKCRNKGVHMVDEKVVESSASKGSAGGDSSVEAKEVVSEQEISAKEDAIRVDGEVLEADDVEAKPDSTLNNKPIESMGPRSQSNVEADKTALGSIADESSPLEVIRTRNEFYRDGYRALQKSVLGLSVGVGVMIVAFVMLFFIAQPKDRFFATTPDGRLIPLSALSEPLLQKPAVLSFAASAATEVMTFGFHDYRDRLQKSSENFTKDGWDGFLKALGDAQYIDAVTNNRQVVSAIPLAPPVIVAEGLSDGVYKWSIEVPLNLSVESGSQIASKKIVVKMVVARRSRVEHDKGLGVDQWITSPYTGGK
jgi:intracellular multiplication protein IcmL